MYNNIEFKYVAGNNDFSLTALQEDVVEFSNIKLFITHGHKYNLNALFYKAEENNCNYALFGHTHISEKRVIDNITILNPGSISRPRDGSFSYAVIEIENGKCSDCIIKEVY